MRGIFVKGTDLRRLYNAVCGWLETDAGARGTPDEPIPEGAFSDTMPAEDHTPPRFKIGFGHSQEDDES